MGLGFKIFALGLKNIVNISLWVRIDQRKTGAVDLDLQFVALFKRMVDVLQLEIDLCFFVWCKQSRLLKAILTQFSNFYRIPQLLKHSI